MKLVKLAKQIYLIEPDLNEGVDTIITGWGLTSGGGYLAPVLQEMTVGFPTTT